jgi:hypothetical protein
MLEMSETIMGSTTHCFRQVKKETNFMVQRAIKQELIE